MFFCGGLLLFTLAFCCETRLKTPRLYNVVHLLGCSSLSISGGLVQALQAEFPCSLKLEVLSLVPYAYRICVSVRASSCISDICADQQAIEKPQPSTFRLSQLVPSLYYRSAFDIIPHTTISHTRVSVARVVLRKITRASVPDGICNRRREQG